MRTGVLTFGETMGAIRSQGQLGIGPAPALSIAGAESNVAIGLARLGHRSTWVSALGADAMGDLVVRTLAGERVDVSQVRRVSGRPTGLLVSGQRPMGRARVDYHRAGSAFTSVTADDITTALATEPAIVHLTGITPALGPGPAAAVTAAIAQARDHGVLVSFDVNFRSRLWGDVDAARRTLTELAHAADVVFGGLEELALVASPGSAGPVAELAGQISQLVVKLGENGARGLTHDEDVTEPAIEVQVTDPIGAGDAFVAGYLSALLDEAPLRERLSRANLCGGLAVATSGDWEGLPTREDLTLFDSEPGHVQR